MSKKSKKQNHQSVQSVAIEGERKLSIIEAAHETGLSQIYVRNAIRAHDLPTTMVPVTPESKTMKHLIAESALLQWRADRATRSRREDGRAKFTLYATAEEKQQIETLLANEGIGALIEKAYTKKAQTDDDEAVEAEPETA